MSAVFFRTAMSPGFWPVFNTLLFTIVLPGTVAILVPRWFLGGFSRPQGGVLSGIGAIVFLLGAAIYFRCVWEFAVRGLGTPAPIAPTKFLVTTALDRYVRTPVYLGVALAILGEAALSRSPGCRRIRRRDAADCACVRRLLRGTNIRATVRRIV